MQRLSNCSAGSRDASDLLLDNGGLPNSTATRNSRRIAADRQVLAVRPFFEKNENAVWSATEDQLSLISHHFQIVRFVAFVLFTWRSRIPVMSSSSSLISKVAVGVSECSSSPAQSCVGRINGILLESLTSKLGSLPSQRHSRPSLASVIDGKRAQVRVSSFNRCAGNRIRDESAQLIRWQHGRKAS